VEHVARREELPEELVDEPVEIRLDVPVDVLARPLDDAVASAPEPRETELGDSRSVASDSSMSGPRGSLLRSSCSYTLQVPGP